MGTNYYAQDTRDNEEFHIGKKSKGWKFLWYMVPKQHLFTSKDWITFLMMHHMYFKIYDESGQSVDFDDLFQYIAVDEETDKSHLDSNSCVYQDADGCEFTIQEFE